MAFASALRAGIARDTIFCGRHAAVAARNVGVRRMAAASAVAGPEAPPLYSEAVLKAPETQMGKLNNGVRVATQAGSGPLASLSVSVDVGTRYENKQNNGVCSVIGAAGFKGKEASIAAMGGQFSVVVDREHVTYSATVLKADVPKAMEILATAAKGSNISSETVEAAKHGVQADIAAAHANPQLNLMDHLHDAAFLDTAMGMPAIGTATTVDALTADDVKAFADRSVAGPRVIVAGAGAVHQGALTDVSESLLGGLVATPPTAIEETLEPAYFIGSDKRMRFDSMKDAKLAVAFRGPAAGSEYSMPIMLMKALFGNYDETSLVGDNAATKWRQDMASLNLAKSASPFYLPYKDAGLIGVQGVVADNNLDNFMWYTMWNLMYLCHKVTEAEVEMAKTHLKAAILQKTSGAVGASADIARQIMQHGRRISAAELVARVDSITVNDVRKTASMFINDQDHALAAVGPIHELPDYNWIRRRSFWLRY